MWTSDAICFVRVMFCRTWYNVSSLIPSHYPHTRIVIVSHTRRLTSSGIRSHTHTRIRLTLTLCDTLAIALSRLHCVSRNTTRTVIPNLKCTVSLSKHEQQPWFHQHFSDAANAAKRGSPRLAGATPPPQ